MMLSGSRIFTALLSLAWVSTFAVANEAITSMSYTDINDPDFELMGYMTLPPSLLANDKSKDKLPAVVIIPDWDNVNDYEIARATMLSEELGYIAFTADIYGADMHDVQDMGTKSQQATKYRSDPALFNSRINSAIAHVKASSPNVDPDRVAIIGYCLGGTGVIGYSFDNTDDATSEIVGAVSFHGGLMDFEVTGEMASPILVLSGGADDAGTAVEDLENRLKEADSTWQITRYSGVEHGWTNWDSPVYHEWADQRSWMEMSSFLKERFGEVEYGTIEPTVDTDYTVVGIDTATGRMDEDGMVRVETVSYDDEGFALEGYLALPSVEAGETRPALLILPDWDGVNGPTGYEAGRAVMAAKEGGYVAMVADIYGTNYTNVDDNGMRGQLATKYRSDPDLFVSRIQAGVNQLLAHPSVDSSSIFVAGYCLGGTGAIDYAFSSGVLENVKAAVPVHGGLTPLRAIQTDVVQPYVLVLSGGVDDAHGNTTELEAHLDGASATWEISRYSNAQHGFSKWGTGSASRYDAMADSRSWWSMMSLFDTLSQPEPQTVVDVAVSIPDTFSSLVDFVVQADLVTPLSTTEGITVFAPTNDAFTALANAAPTVVGNLQTDEWSAHLQDVLLNHVLPLEVPSSAVTEGLTATTLNGEDLSFAVNKDGIFINSVSEVIIPDVAASNGVIHAIDNVLLPSWVTNSIVDRAVGSPDLTTLVTLVVEAELADTLSGAGPFTVFAPTNDALALLGDLSIASSFDIDMVAFLLTYHVVSGIYTAADITNGLSLTTLQGEEISFSLMDNTAMVNGAPIVAADILANNGIVHVIDGVLIPPPVIPPPEADPTVVEVAVSIPDTFSSLVDLVILADLVTPLSTTQGITVFAPTNDAFEALAGAAPSVVAHLQTKEWGAHLKDVLLHHVLPIEVSSSGVTDGLTATTLNGEDLSFSLNDGVFVNSVSEVIIPDVAASNGVIHAIDNVLLPSWVSNSIVDRAVGSPLLTTLVDLVGEAGLAGTLSMAGPFTVFAPTNDAFVELLGDDFDINSLDIDMVASILTYHVVRGIYTASDMENGLSLTTIQGEEVLFMKMGDAAMVNGRTVVAADILANNGVVHVIDGVLVPPTEEDEEEHSHDEHSHDLEEGEDHSHQESMDDSSANSLSAFGLVAIATLFVALLC